MGTGLVIGYDFSGQLAKSDTEVVRAQVCEYLRKAFPNVTNVSRSFTGDDRTGVDYWVIVSQDKSISVDVKVRELDPIDCGYGDDVALEIWSVVGRSVGWTLDAGKKTDYVLWYWTTTGRFFMVPFLMLCKVFRDNYDAWTRRYKHATQDSGSWKSECVFVPREELVRAMYDAYWDKEPYQGDKDE